MLLLASLLVSLALAAVKDCPDCATYHATLKMTDSFNCSNVADDNFASSKQKLRYNEFTVTDGQPTLAHETCNKMPTEWIGKVGTDLTKQYLSFSLVCTWNKAEKDVMKWSSSVYTDDACKTKVSGETLFADDYISGTCFEDSKEVNSVATAVARQVVFDQQALNLCMGITPTPTVSPTQGGAAGLFASVSFIAAAIAALF